MKDVEFKPVTPLKVGRPRKTWESKQVSVPVPILGEVKALIEKWKAEQSN